MFCPRCGQEQISTETRFCSRCGFLMTGVGALIANDGNPGAIAPFNPSKIDSPRRRGVKQGMFIFMLSFLVVPIISILTIMAGAEPFAVVISVILLTVGGLLRMIYAWMFESAEPAAPNEQSSQQNASNILTGSRNQNALPPQQSIPTSSYMPPRAANWRDTNDLEPSSVTDATTKLLQKEE
jgi:predicted membrane channel-forming protein YqfA (hemolysin III family)